VCVCIVELGPTGVPRGTAESSVNWGFRFPSVERVARSAGDAGVCKENAQAQEHT
jgi:hypothetical protein